MFSTTATELFSLKTDVLQISHIPRTEANAGATEADEPAAGDWKGGGRNPNQTQPAGAASSASLSMQQRAGAHGGKVKFDPPKVPVIFVLGGPGSGKVTHCDTLMQERKGIAHINMMDLLQQYAIGNGEQPRP